MTKEKDPSRHDLTRHHLQCRSNGGGNGDSNISLVPKNQHSAFHLLFSNMLPPTICHILNDKFLDRRYKFICVDSSRYEKITKIISQLT